MNSAARLRDVLSRMLSAPSQGTCLEVLAVFFELAPSRESLQGHNAFPVVPKVQHYLTEILNLTDETERELGTLDDRYKVLFKATFPHIRNTISTYMFNPVGNWESYLGELQKVDFRGLEFAADTLSRSPVEETIPASTLKDFLHEVDEFYEEVLSSDIHWEAKYFILDRLDEIRLALREYYITGVKGLRNCIGKTIGLMFVNSHLLESDDDSPKAKARNKLWDFVTRLSGIADLGIKVIQVAEKARPAIKPLFNAIKAFLGPGDPPTVE